MEQLKRQRNTPVHDYEDNKTKKLRVTTDDPNKTYFEVLSNDLMYEIFDYLDIYHVYKGFYDLNERFEKLLTNSTLPMKINITSMSKSNFHRYCLHIIKPNKRRITLLRLTTSFTVNTIFPCPTTVTKFTRLQTLILENIESKDLSNILCYALLYSPNLCSLIIHSVDEILCADLLYYQIFSLRALKYCKITFEAKSNFEFLEMSQNKTSSIEHLVINHRVWLSEIDSILSCLPRLRRLSINCLDGSRYKRTKIDSIQLKHLTHVSFKLECLSFNRFKQLMIDYFHQAQVLRISTRYDTAFLDANRWEQFILMHMSHLRIFDIHHTGAERSYNNNNNNNKLTYHDLINKFASPFWIERHWFFTHQHDWQRISDRGVFYSTNPYKRKSYTLYWETDENCCPSRHETNLDIVTHVNICSTQSMNNCVNYLPNVTKLTFVYNYKELDSSMVTALNRIFPLSRLTKLAIESSEFPFEQLIKLLCSTPNMHTLNLRSISIDYTEYKSTQQSESFRLVSSINIIKNVIIDECCILKKIQLLIRLCPRLEHLTAGMNRKEFLLIVRFLLAKNNNNTRHLFFLCVLDAPKVSLRELKKLIKIEKLLGDFSINHIERKLYLWW